jgi:hypothetical protein
MLLQVKALIFLCSQQLVLANLIEYIQPFDDLHITLDYISYNFRTFVENQQ